LNGSKEQECIHKLPPKNKTARKTNRYPGRHNFNSLEIYFSFFLAYTELAEIHREKELKENKKAETESPKSQLSAFSCSDRQVACRFVEGFYLKIHRNDQTHLPLWSTAE